MNLGTGSSWFRCPKLCAPIFPCVNRAPGAKGGSHRTVAPPFGAPVERLACEDQLLLATHSERRFSEWKNTMLLVV